MIRFEQLQWGPPGRALTPPVSLHLPAGSLTAVVGANGSGKSSLLRVVAGQHRPLAGRVTLAAPRLGGIAYLQQQQQFDRQFPISLQALVAAGLWRSPAGRRERRQQLRAALADWQLEGLEERPLQALSGGELQRALLARLSLVDAPLLLLDEPEAALDDAGRALFWQHVARWQAQGRTQLLVSHDLQRRAEQLRSGLLIDAAGCVHAPVRELFGNQRRLGEVA